MRRVMTAVIVAGLLAPVSVFAGSLEVRGGKFFPKADSTIFNDNEDLFNTRKEDWPGVTGGLEYAWRSGDNLELGIHLDAYGKKLDTSYRDYERPSGGEIEQTLQLNTVPLGLTARYMFAGRHSRIQPYVGLGVDVVFWEYKEFGSFIDFENDFDIVEFDEFVANGAAPAAHVTAGLRVGLTPDIFLTAEGRYLAAKGQDMGDDFEVARSDVAPNHINVSGASFTIGALLRF